MKKKILSLLMALCTLASMSVACIPTASAAEASVKFYVSPDGDDTEDGSINFPFRTLNQARQAVINYKKDNGMPAGGIDVIIRGGTYDLSSSGLHIPADAGGEDGKFVTYKAYEGEDVYLDGSWEIEHDYFELVTDQALLERLPEESRGKVYSVDLKELGIDANAQSMIPWYPGGSSPWNPDVEFYYNDQAMTSARWPNEEQVMYGIVLQEGTYEKTGLDAAGVTQSTSGEQIFQFDNERLDRWTNAGTFYASGDWGMGWYQHSIEISNVNTTDRSLTTYSDCQYGIKDMKKCYFYNLFEELDVPGEYYIDKETNTMYVCTNGTIDGVKITVSDNKNNAIKIDEAHYVRFQGLTIQNFAKAGIYGMMKDPHNYATWGIEVIDCTLRNLGGHAIFLYNGRDVLVTDCRIYNVGGQGVAIFNSNIMDQQGWETLEDHNIKITNNEVFRFSRHGKSYIPAFGIYQHKAVIKNNTVHDTPHQAVTLGSPGVNISYNEFYNCVTNADDAGVIYGGRNWVSTGTIANNYFHANGAENTSGFSGVYLDDSLAWYTIRDNIFENLTMSAAFSAHNTFENNLVIGKTSSSHAAGVAVDWRMQAVYNREDIQKNLDQYSKYMNNDTWRAERPWMFEALDENFQIKEEWFWPHSTVKNNIFMKAAPLNIVKDVYTYSEIVNNYETKKTLDFADYAKGDLTLSEEAVADYPGFEPIDFYSIGVQPSEYNPQTLIERRLEDCVVLDIDNKNALVDNEKKQIDETDEKVAPVIVGDRTLVPLRFIAEGFGADVQWDDATRTVTITLGDKTIKMPIDSTTYELSGRTFNLDVPAQIMNGRTMVPVRVVAESLDKQVFWDNRGLIIIGDMTDYWNSADDKYRITQIFESLK